MPLTDTLTWLSGDLVDWNNVGGLLRRRAELYGLTRVFQHYTFDELVARGEIIAATLVGYGLGYCLTAANPEASPHRNGAIGATLGFTLSHVHVVRNTVARRKALKQKGVDMKADIETRLSQSTDTRADNELQLAVETLAQAILDLRLPSLKRGDNVRNICERNRLMKALSDEVDTFLGNDSSAKASFILGLESDWINKHRGGEDAAVASAAHAKMR